MATDEYLLSILIPTLESRRMQCEHLCREIDRQILLAGAGDLVEVLTLRDSGSASVGEKRNQLVSSARGRFIVFIDDDDMVSSDYVDQLTKVLQTHPEADCVSFTGEISFRGAHRRSMVHSIEFTDWHHRRGQYLRPPCHITPIRREIASRYAFAEVDYAEDMDWSLRLSRDQALKREVILDRTLYFYHCRRHYFTQWLLDRTQMIRHATGLRFVSGLAFRQKCRSILRRSGA